MSVELSQNNAAPARLRKSWVPSKQFWRRFIIVLGLISPLLIRVWVLSKVPEIDVPFDVQEVCRVEFNPGENAFDYFREAHRLRVAVNTGFSNQQLESLWRDLNSVLSSEWGTATTALEETLPKYSEALKVWQRGTLCTDGCCVLPANLDNGTAISEVASLRVFFRLACCEGMRLESEGKLAEAADSYVASVRSSSLVSRHGCLVQQSVANEILRIIHGHLVRWSEDSRVTTDQLRLVLDQIRVASQQTEPPSTVLKVEFLAFSKTLQKPDWCRDIGMTENYANNVPYASTGMGAYCWIIGEPEFARRTVLQALANQLPEIDRPKHKRTATTGTGMVMLFEPRNALGKNQLPPAAIERAVQRSFVANRVLSAFKQFDSVMDRNRATWIGLELTLIVQIYFREHGEFPADTSAMIPKYIDAWPVDPMQASPEQPMEYERECPTSARIRSRGQRGFDVTLQTR